MYVVHRAMHTAKGIVCFQINPLNAVTKNEITSVLELVMELHSAVEKLTFIEGNVCL